MRASRGSLSKRAIRLFGALAVRQLHGGRGSRLSVLHVSMRPYSRAPALRHARTDEFLLVLKGSSSGRIGRRKVRFKAGDFAYLPAGTPHEFRAGPGGTELLDIFLPRLDLSDPDIVLERRS